MVVSERARRQEGSRAAPKSGLLPSVCWVARARSLARAAARLASIRALTSGVRACSLKFSTAVGERAVDLLLVFIEGAEGLEKKEVIDFCMLDQRVSLGRMLQITSGDESKVKIADEG